MTYTPLDLAAGGLLQASVWTLALYCLAATLVTIFAVTLYLHRRQAHRGVDFHPGAAHVFRVWTWLTTSMVTRQWVAIHRKHHARCETEEDPHSPRHEGIGRVGLGHWGGDRHFETTDTATNLVPWGAGIGGEGTLQRVHA